MCYKKGDWIVIDDTFTQIIGVYPINYENFDSDVKDGVARKGEHKQNYYLLRSLCDFTGKFVSGKPYVQFFDYDFEMLDDDFSALLEKVKTKKAEKFTEWRDKVYDDKVQICHLSFSFEVKSKEGAGVLKRFKKLCKQLPSLFSYDDLVSYARAAGIDLSTCVDDFEAFDNQVSFSLKFKLDNIKDGVIYFHKVFDFDYTDALEDQELLENFFNFESLFLSFVLFLNRYNTEVTDKAAQSFSAALKKAAPALGKGEWKNDELANQFYQFVPKKMFTKIEAFEIFRNYVELKRDLFKLNTLCKTLDEKHDWCFEIYSLSYDWAKAFI